MKMNPQQQFEIISELEKLKAVHRQNITLEKGRNENPAEHSWHIAVMALFMPEQTKGLDLLKILKMLLIHDLGEIHSGDTSVFDDDARVAAEKEERKGMRKFLEKLPRNLGTELMNLWEEFLAGSTGEAKFAKALDALQPLINWAALAPRNFNPYEINASVIYEKKNFIRDEQPGLWPLAEYAINKSI
ncbi:MAG: HD domain-containing protein, partial [Spirochaetales bacterium]|nr:HD domain-containing protein [Spirochaetales bacterium]